MKGCKTNACRCRRNPERQSCIPEICSCRGCQFLPKKSAELSSEAGSNLEIPILNEDDSDEIENESEESDFGDDLTNLDIELDEEF